MEDQVTSVLIADDQYLFAKCLKIVLENSGSDITVCGLAKDGFEAIELSKREKPDVILMDIRMPGLDGLEALAGLLKIDSKAKILMLTTFPDDDYVQKAMENGAKGYLLKEIDPEVLLKAIQMVMAGMKVMSEVAPKPSISKSAQFIFGQKPNESSNLESLSEKEQQILHFLKAGYSNKEIADKVLVAEQTVKNYVSVIYEKIGIHNRRELRRTLSADT
jgi:DNA-binding NarL/FixJ family response regulator